MLSRTVLVDIAQGNQIAIVFASDYGSLYSDFRYQTSLKGFLYKPYRNDPISWCVLWAQDINLQIFDPIDPVRFNAVLVNQGSGWKEASNMFITPLTGVYYIQLTAGIFNNSPTKMELLVNGYLIINVFRQFTSHEHWDTQSRAIILRLEQNDTVRVRLPSGYTLNTNEYEYTGFAGFRIYA